SRRRIPRRDAPAGRQRAAWSADTDDTQPRDPPRQHPRHPAHAAGSAAVQHSDARASRYGAEAGYHGETRQHEEEWSTAALAAVPMAERVPAASAAVTAASSRRAATRPIRIDAPRRRGLLSPLTWFVESHPSR